MNCLSMIYESKELYSCEETFFFFWIDISRVEVSQKVGKGWQVIREGEKVGVQDIVFEAKWSELGARKQVGNCNREVRITVRAG